MPLACLSTRALQFFLESLTCSHVWLICSVYTLSILLRGDHNCPLSTWREGEWVFLLCILLPWIILPTTPVTFLLLVFTYLSLELLWNARVFKPKLFCMSFGLQFSSVVFSGEGRSQLSTSTHYLGVSERPRGRVCVARTCLAVLTAAEWPAYWVRYGSGKLCPKQRT